MKRNMRAMTFEDAMALIDAGKFAAPRNMGRGWYVYAAGGERWAHNPYHGAGPSGRDHAFRATDADRAAKWFEISL